MRNISRTVIVLAAALLCAFGSTQGGWEKMGVPCPCDLRALAFLGSDLYAGAVYPNGILVSHNNGANWESLGLTGTQVLAIAGSGPNLLAGLDYSEGAYLSTDGGASWSGKVIENASIFTFLVTGSTVLAGADSGRIYRSTDNGATWTEGNVGDICLVRAFAIQGASIFAGTDLQWPMASGLGVLRSTDDGITWTPTAMSGLFCNEEWGLCVSGNNLIAATCNGIYTSTDGASNWTETANDWALGGGFKSDFALGDGKVFATAVGGGPIPMSANNGLNWTNINQKEFDVSHGVSALAVNGEYLFAASAINDRAVWRCPLSDLYICGDANNDAVVDISDGVYLITFIFAGGPAPLPDGIGDANCDGSVDISDVVYLIAYIFAGGPTPCAVCN